EIGKERSPAPICFCNSCHMCDIAEITVSLIQVKHVEHVLVMISDVHHFLKIFRTHRSHHPFRPNVIFRNHIQHSQISKAIIVDVGNIRAHTVKGNMSEMIENSIAKSAITLVEVEVIWFAEIIADVYVRTAVVVEISY